MNDCRFLGRLVFEPERFDLKNDLVKVNCRLAVDRSYKNKDGERDSDFFDFVAWGDRAEVILKHFHIGDAVIFYAEAQQDQWKDKETDENRQRVVFQITKVEFLPLNPKGKASQGKSEDKDEDKPKSRAKNAQKAKSAKRPWESEEE